MGSKKALIRWMVFLFVLMGFFVALLSIVPEQNSDRVCFEDACVYVEFAITHDEIATGLMYRTHLPESSGMLFVFEDPGVYRFWMKNTFIPLDIIWMDEDGRVVYVERDVQPCRSSVCPSYGPHIESKYVLEVNAGYAQNNGIDVGDVVNMF